MKEGRAPRGSPRWSHLHLWERVFLQSLPELLVDKNQLGWIEFWHSYSEAQDIKRIFVNDLRCWLLSSLWEVWGWVEAGGGWHTWYYHLSPGITTTRHTWHYHQVLSALLSPGLVNLRLDWSPWSFYPVKQLFTIRSSNTAIIDKSSSLWLNKYYWPKTLSCQQSLGRSNQLLPIAPPEFD